MMTDKNNDKKRLEDASWRINVWLGECNNKDSINQAFFLYQELRFLDNETQEAHRA